MERNEKTTMITTILFDMDGTLLPMDQENFTKGYFRELVRKFAPYGYEPEQFTKTVWDGTGAMVKNDGSRWNEQAFWEVFSSVYGEEKTKKDKGIFDDFYSNEFMRTREFCGYNPQAAQAVRKLKDAGYRLVLATNPVFPAEAIEARIRWAGIEPEEFVLRTTYENTRYCKPNPDYYREISQKLGVLPEECLMAGNDVRDDMTAETVGMQVFLMTDCLINRENKELSKYPKGSFSQLLDYILNIRQSGS